MTLFDKSTLKLKSLYQIHASNNREDKSSLTTLVIHKLSYHLSPKGPILKSNYHNLQYLIPATWVGGGFINGSAEETYKAGLVWTQVIIILNYINTPFEVFFVIFKAFCK